VFLGVPELQTRVAHDESERLGEGRTGGHARETAVTG
jgi:hypothetical protein